MLQSITVFISLSNISFICRLFTSLTVNNYANYLFISNEEKNGDYDFGGVIGIYDHPAEDKETLFVPGPLKKPLTLYVW